MKLHLPELFFILLFATSAIGQEPQTMIRMNLNQITLPSTNLKNSISFYKKLGFKQIVGTEDYARFESSLGDATFSLHTVKTVPSEYGAVVYFEVDSVSNTVSQLKAQGFEFEEDATEQTWLWTEAYLRDPSGNLICIYHAGVNRKNPPWRLST